MALQVQLHARLQCNCGDKFDFIGEFGSPAWRRCRRVALQTQHRQHDPQIRRISRSDFTSALKCLQAFEAP